MAPPFWLDNPAVLLKQNSIFELWPKSTMTSNQKLNAVTRLVVVMTVLGYAISRKPAIAVTGCVTLAAVIVLRYARRRDSKQSEIEGFISPTAYELMPDAFQKPVPTNPAMNLLETQISDDPDRKPAAPAYNPKVRDEMDEATKEFVASSFDVPRAEIEDKLFKDLGDAFTFDQSMRTWYATANTQVPNDQHAFAEFCYGNMPSCKEGNALACERGMPPNWTNGTNA